MDLRAILKRIEGRLEATGKSAQAVSLEAGLSKDAIRNLQRTVRSGRTAGASTQTIDALARPLGVTPAYLLTGESGSRSIVPIVGFLGAGAEILPEFEQAPPEGFGEVQLAFAVPEEIIGLEIKGDSMLPRYRDGDVLLVWREQRRDTRSFVGEEAAVRIRDGRRFVKNILRGPEPGTFTLESWNARPIEGVFIDWIGEIYLMVPRTQLRRLERVERAAAARRARKRATETDGMEELPIEGSREAG